jgi:cytochrome P450
MHARMLLFSRGRRVCLGRALAVTELRMTLTSVAGHYSRVRLAPLAGETDVVLQMRDHFRLGPRGRRCLLLRDER